MGYYLDIFSPETYENFSKSDRTITGFRLRQEKTAARIKPGDKLICYMTKLSRWIGILEVVSESFIDESPRFFEEDDPFVVRFRVKPILWLDKEKAIPIKEDFIWTRLSFTKEHEKGSSKWIGKFRSSLTNIDDEDGHFLEESLKSQNENGDIYPVDETEYQKLLSKRVRGIDKTITVSVPEDLEPEDVEEETPIRVSTKVQAILARIGEIMGFKIWIPRHDRSRVLEEWEPKKAVLIETLPLNYDQVTLKTIEQIDVLWLKRRSIVRAFEVEHTTSIYSGILRMADLLALQPNMDIKLHLVAPSSRRDKVFQELQRPVFSLLERGPLSDICTFISYDSVYDLVKEKHLSHLSDSVLEDFDEFAE